MSAELIHTDAGYWLITGTPGNYQLHQIDLVERAAGPRKHVLRRQVMHYQITRQETPR